MKNLLTNFLRNPKNKSIRHVTLAMTTFFAVAMILVQLIYFIQINRLRNESAENYANRFITQTQSSVESCFTGVSTVTEALARNRILQNYLIDAEPYEHYLQFRNVEAYISSSVQLNTDILTAVVIDTDLSPVYYSDLIFGLRPTVDFFNISDALADTRDTPVYFFGWHGGDAYPICAMQIIGTAPGQTFRQHLGYVIVVIDPEVLTELFTSDPESTVWLSEGLAQASWPYVPEELQTARSTSIISRTAAIAAAPGWTVHYLVNTSSSRAYYLPLFYTILLIIGITLLLLFLTSQVYNRYLTAPVLSLQKELKDLHYHGLHTELEGDYPGEIGEIAGSINEMVENMYDLTKKIVTTQEQAYEAKLSEEQAILFAMQMQTNPHFLFNTLQSLAGIAAEHGERDIVTACISLSKILRYAVNREAPGPNGSRIEGSSVEKNPVTKPRLIHVREELDIAREYLKIVEIRFHGRCHSEFAVDEGILDSVCMKMLLQPIVENAVLHGIENTYKDGMIRITGHREGDYAILEVHDNGTGIPAEKLDELQKKLANDNVTEIAGATTGHIGIMNVHTRMKIHFGKEYGIQILYSGPEGTGIALRMPFWIPEV